MKCHILRRALFFLVLANFLPVTAGHGDERFQVNVGPEFLFARYNYSSLSHIQGYLGGVHADVCYAKKKCTYLELSFDGLWDAGCVRGEDDLDLKVRDYRTELKFGYSWHTNSGKVIFRPLAGVGFDYLLNRFQGDGSCDGMMAYRFYNIYVPLGFSMLRRCGGCFELGFRIWYRVDAWTRLKVETPNVDSCGDKIKSRKRVHAIHAEVPFLWHRGIFHNKCGECFDMVMKFVPFFDWFRFDKTNESTQLCVQIPTPKLNRWYVGAHLDLGFIF